LDGRDERELGAEVGVGQDVVDEFDGLAGAGGVDHAALSVVDADVVVGDVWVGGGVEEQVACP
jgi:hypothetical protein